MNSMNVSASESQELMDSLRPHLASLQKVALIAAVIGIAGSAFGAVTDPKQFFQSYIFGYLFWFSFSAGSLAILMLHHVVGAGCFFVIRRLIEAASRLFPVLLVLILPIFFGMPALYSWMRPEYLETHPVVQNKVAAWLNMPFFVGRTFFYFAVWMIFAFFLNKLSKRQDQDLNKEEAEELSNKLNMLGSGGLLAFAFTITFAAFDWLMTMDPEWYSSLFGAYIAIGMFLSTLAGMTVLLYLIAGRTSLLQRVPKKYYRDLGNLTLAFSLLWAYMSFSQFVIIWTANLGDEVVWFLARMRHNWQYVAGGLIFIHFALPFFTLLVGNRIKKNIKLLAGVAAFILIMRSIDLFWIIEPTYRHHGLELSYLDLTTLVGVGGVWLYFFIHEMKKTKYLITLHDPRFINELAGSEGAHGHSHGAHNAAEVAAHV